MLSLPHPAAISSVGSEREDVPLLPVIPQHTMGWRNRGSSLAVLEFISKLFFGK